MTSGENRSATREVSSASRISDYFCGATGGSAASSGGTRKKNTIGASGALGILIVLGVVRESPT